MKLQTVGICMKPDQPQAAGLVRGLEKWLEERGLRLVLDEDAAVHTGASGASRAEVVGSADLVVVLGGDGTLLSVARSAGSRAVPILGVNLGTLGFMTEISQDEMYAAFERVLGGQMRVESRMRLAVRALRGDQVLGEFLALNDAVLANATSACMVEVQTRVDGDEMTTYHADGLIVSTPTGSTAYSLSAGGPVVDPEVDALVLTPVAPHSLLSRSLILAPEAVISVTVEIDRPARVNVDGREVCLVEPGRSVEVRRGAERIRFLTLGRHPFPQAVRHQFGLDHA